MSTNYFFYIEVINYGCIEIRGEVNKDGNVSSNKNYRYQLITYWTTQPSIKFLINICGSTTFTRLLYISTKGTFKREKLDLKCTMEIFQFCQLLNSRDHFNRPFLNCVRAKEQSHRWKDKFAFFLCPYKRNCKLVLLVSSLFLSYLGESLFIKLLQFTL